MDLKKKKHLKDCCLLREHPKCTLIKVSFAAASKSLTFASVASILVGPCWHVTLGFVRNELMTSGSSKCRLTPEKTTHLLVTQTEFDRACCLLWNSVEIPL